jgi:hypothetical protein
MLPDPVEPRRGFGRLPCPLCGEKGHVYLPCIGNLGRFSCYACDCEFQRADVDWLLEERRPVLAWLDLAPVA